MKLRTWIAALASVLAIGAWTFGCTNDEGTSPVEITSACTGGHDTMDPTCNLCLGDLCCAEQNACAPGTECDKTFTCLSGCTGGDTACVQTCGMNAQGYVDHDKLIHCLLTNCQKECLPGAICDSGVGTPDKHECGDCLGASCCEQYRDCTADTGCRTCLSTPTSAGCVANPLVVAVNNCSSTHCAAACQ